MNNSGFISPGGRSAGCLGNPAHPVTEQDVLCPFCGRLVQDTMIGPYQVKRLLRSFPGTNQEYARSNAVSHPTGALAEYAWRSQFYLATRSDLNQPVLLKIFPPDPASQHLWKQAWQDIQRIPALQQSSILPVLDCRLWYPASSAAITFHGNFFTATNRHTAFLIVVYQYAPQTLSHVLQASSSGSLTKMLTLKQLLRFIEQAVTALTFVHNLGFAHGDLEPDNVFFDTQFNQLWIAGFGLGRFQPPPSPFLAPELLSTVRFCEQYQNMTPYWQTVTEASDQYALAVLCYHLFSRAVPPAFFQRILPVLHRAAQANPALRFKHPGDFSSALAAEFGVGQLFLPEPTTSAHQVAPAGKNLPPPPAADTPAGKRAQKANQLEQIAGGYFTAHDYQAAARVYMQVTQLDATRASAWLGLADTYFALERYEEALEAYTQALALDPQNADAWFNRATVFDLLGQAERAAHDYAQAERLRTEA